MNGKTPHYELVEQFSVMAGQERSAGPGKPSEATRILRAKLALEEALELCAGLGVSVKIVLNDGGEEKVAAVNGDALEFAADGLFDLEEVVDACCDVRVVTTGCLVAVGVKDEEVQQVVDLNNLRKFGPGHSIRADGKLVKPPNHPKPDIGRVIRMQIREYNRTRLPGEAHMVEAEENGIVTKAAPMPTYEPVLIGEGVAKGKKLAAAIESTRESYGEHH